MKQIMEPIRLEGENILWRGRTFAIEETLDHWCWRGRWWLDPQLRGEKRSYYRVLCKSQRQQRVMEIFCRQQRGERSWVLSRVVD